MSLTLYEIWKIYEHIIAVRNVNLNVDSGSIVAISGPNGSGKTTLLRILAGLDPPSKGIVRVFRFKPGSLEARSITSIMLDKPLLLEELTVSENISFYTKLLHGRISELAVKAYELLGVGKFKNIRVGMLSHGWKRRVDFIRALLNNPKLLLIDELTTGFDIDSINIVTKIIVEVAKSGSIAIVTGPSWNHLEPIIPYSTVKCYMEGGILSCSTH
ncbi:MAG: ABC transporter ATP-binding protein [Acidilobaceae archaeon]